MIVVGIFKFIMFAIFLFFSVNGLGKFIIQAWRLLSNAIVGGAVFSYLRGLIIDNYS